MFNIGHYMLVCELIMTRFVKTVNINKYPNDTDWTGELIVG